MLIIANYKCTDKKLLLCPIPQGWTPSHFYSKVRKYNKPLIILQQCRSYGAGKELSSIC